VVATVSRLCFLTEIQWLSVITACERKLRQRQRGCDSWAAKRKRWVMLVVASAGRTLKYRLIKHIREFRGIMCRYPPRESFDPIERKCSALFIVFAVVTVAVLRVVALPGRPLVDTGRFKLD